MRVLFIILIPFLSFSQQQQPGQFFIATGSETFAWNTQVLQSVTDIATCSTANNTTLSVTDIVRGGRFVKYTGTDAADGGMIFADALGGKWKRVITDGISIAWYGAATAEADNMAYVIAVKNYLYSHGLTKMIVPKGNYQMSDSVLFDKNIIIEGEGVIGYPTSQFTFPAGKTGFVFQYVTDGFGVDMRNIMITGQLTPGYNVTNKHAIVQRTRGKFENVVISQFDGNGFHISACGTQPNGDNNNLGVADNSIYRHVAAYYCTTGFFTEGCDGHILDIGEGCDFSQNRRWGYYGNGLLGGDVLYKTHFAFNGVAVPGANSVVTYNSKYYVAKAGYDGYFGDAADSNYNKQPDTNPNYWHEVTPTMIATAWQNNARYYSGGAAIVRNVNARTLFYHCYTEGSQPPVFLNTRSEWTGANAGADVVGGVSENILYGEKHLYNGGFLVQKYAHIGTTTYDAAAQLKVYNDYSTTSTRVSIKSEGSTNEINQQFKNSTGATGTIQYIDSSFKIYSKTNVLAATIDSAGITANKFFGDGSALTGVTGSGAAWGQITGTLSNQTDLQTALNGKQAAGTYATGTGSATGINTGDNATNTQYSGLAASKQDVLVSGTNIKTINGTTLLGSGDMVISGGGLGYTLSVQSLTSSPADAQTIYFGQLPKAPTTTANISKVYIRKAGTIKMAQIYTYAGTAGTGEAWVMNIRLNNTTDTQIASVASATNGRIFTNSSLNIAVNAGDYIEIKCVNPTWATNPLTFIAGGYIYIE